MTLPDPSFLPQGKPRKSRYRPTPTRAGCCLASGVGGLVGFLVGGYLGVLSYSAAADEAARAGEFFDELPVPPVLGALAGTVIGALAARVLLGLWLRVTRPAKSGSGDLSDL